MLKTKVILRQIIILLICCSPFLNYAQIPYLENFAGQNGKGAVGPTPTIDVAGVDWSINVSAATLSATSDWFQVQGEVMEAQDTDGEVVWTSPSIDVSTSSATVLLSVDLAEQGNHESGDYIKIYYISDGGAETQFVTNGDNSDDFTAVTAEQNLDLTGIDVLQIVIRMKNNAGAEILLFDNVSVTEIAPCADPADQATALNLIPDAISISGSFSTAASNPDNYIVLMSTASTLSSNPLDGTSYNIGDVIGEGTVITKTSLTSFQALELSQSTTYYFFVFSLNLTCSGEPNYNEITPLAGNVATLAVPDIIITEIMQNPAAVVDADGEYFEIYNNSGADVDINGWIIKDNGSNSHTIDNGESLIITDGSFLILGKNNDINTNGGVTVDYHLSTSFSLTNSEDEIIIQNSAGIEVDRVEYNNDDSDFPVPNGASMYLNNINLDNNNGSNWTTSTTSIGFIPASIDKGTPGTIGETNLPIELIHFSAEVNHQVIQLFWQTAAEINNSHFEIQHSIDGKNFQTIGESLGQGTTTLLSKYDFLHQNPINGLNYYRLKQVDFDGRFEWSDVVSANINTKVGTLKIYPNPIQQHLNIQLPKEWTDKTTIDIYSITGQIVRSQQINTSSITINLADLTSGSYFLKAKNSRGIKTAYFLKSK